MNSEYLGSGVTVWFVEGVGTLRLAKAAVQPAESRYRRVRYDYSFAPEGHTSDLFYGSDYECPASWTLARVALDLLAFLTLKPGDTDADYFDRYTSAQRAYAVSSACEHAQVVLSDLSEGV